MLMFFAARQTTNRWANTQADRETDRQQIGQKPYALQSIKGEVTVGGGRHDTNQILCLQSIDMEA